MTRRTSRGIINKDSALEKLKTGRDGAIQVTTEAKIGSPEYQAASAVLDAIDDLVEVLGRDRITLHTKPASTDDQI